MNRHAALIFTALALSISCGAPLSSGNQSDASATTALDALKLPNNTVILARLSNNLAFREAKPGDPVSAEAKQDVKQGHDVLVRKGSSFLGHVTAVQLPTSGKPLFVVELIFDSVRMKDGKQLSLSLPLLIQALAPEADVDSSSSLADHTGTGIENATRTAGVSGHSSTVNGSINQLTRDSNGVYDLQGLRLGDHISNGKHSSVLASSTGEVFLKKGTQLVLKVVSE